MTFRAAFYKGTRPGLPGVYNRLVRAWERGDYSHCELIFSDGWSASASLMDGGVRFKWIEYDPARWDIYELPTHLEHYAREWFIAHDGAKYDLRGNIHLVIGFVPHSSENYFCSEAMAESLQILEGSRFGPNALDRILRWRCQVA